MYSFFLLIYIHRIKKLQEWNYLDKKKKKTFVWLLPNTVKELSKKNAKNTNSNAQKY